MTGEGSYKRVLLKISGEVLMGDGEFGLNPETVDRIAGDIAQVHASGIELECSGAAERSGSV